VQLFIYFGKLPHLKRLVEIIEKVVEKNVNPPIYFEMWSKKYEIRQYNLKCGRNTYVLHLLILIITETQTEKSLAALQLQDFFSILYEQRGWEKFFTVKQRGKCLLVINFTPLIYHIQTPYHNILVCYFTILSNPIHECLDASI